MTLCNAELIRAFENCVEANTFNKGDCLYYLQQYRCQEISLVGDFVWPHREYMSQRLQLEHFGSLIAASHIERVIGWLMVKAEDVKGLQAYALFFL